MADVIYIDADTGETVNPNDLDSYDVQEVYEEPQAQVEVPSWMDTIPTSIGDGIGNFVSKVAGGIDYLEDKTGLDTGIGEYILEEQKPYKEKRRAILDRVPEGSAQDYAGKITSGIASFAPNLAAAPSLLLQAGLQGIESFGGKYSELRDRGVSFEDAEKGAATSGVIDTGLSVLPLAPAMRSQTPLTRRLILSGAGGAIGGGAGEVGQAYSDYVATGEAPTLDELLQRMKTGTIVGAGTGAGMGLGFGIMTPRSPKEASVNNMLNKIDEINAVEAAQMQEALPAPQERLDLPAPEQMGSLPAPEGVTYGDGFTARNPTLSDSSPVGDLPSVQEQAATLESPANTVETIPETRDFTPQESAVPNIDKVAAQEFFNKTAAGKYDPNIDIDTAMKNFPREKKTVPVSELKLSQDVPNFKSGANEKGVVNPLEGDFDDRAQSPIQVWRRKNGDLEVISGRHRLDLAQRTGKDNLDVEIYNEADGFTPEMARILDAELNIRDGQGEVSDFAQYFKFRGTNEEQTAQRGILREPKAKQGFAIGTRGSDDLYALHQAERISDKQAATIADSAPNNPDVQRVGIKLALEKGANADEIRNIMQRAALGNADAGIQGDLFGGNDAAINNAVAMAKLAGQKFKDLNSEIRVLSEAGNKPEILQRYKVPVNNPQALLRRVDQLKVQRDRWNEWGKFPELGDELSRELGFDVPVPAEPVLDNTPPPLPETRPEAAKPPVQPDVQFSLENGESFQKPNSQVKPPTTQPKTNLKSQKGAIRIPELPEFSLDGVRKFLNKGLDIERQPQVYRYFDSSTARELNKMFAHQSSKAAKFPEFKPFYDKAIKYQENKNAYAYDSWDKLGDYSKLNKKSKQAVNNALIAARIKGREFVPNDQKLQAMGLDGDQIAAYKSVREWADYNLDLLKNEEIQAAQHAERNVDLEKIEAKYAELRQENYVPFTRFGKFRMDVYNPDGSVDAVRMSDSKGELAQYAKEAHAKGQTIKVQKMMMPTKQEYAGISPDILNIMGDTDGGIPVVGFKKHFEQARKLSGFDADLERSMAEYTAGLSNYLATKQFKRESSDLFKRYKNLPEKEAIKYGGMLKEAAEYHKFMTTPSRRLAGVHRFFSDYYLAGNIKTAAVNLTQPITTTYPMLAKYTSGLKLAPEKIMIKAALKTKEYATSSKEKFLAKNPELASAIHDADRRGILNASVFNEITGRAHTVPSRLNTWRDKIYFFNDLSERSNRIHSFIAGWEAYPEALKKFYSDPKNGEAPSRQKFAENFTRETQFDYTKADRPNLSREGLGKLAYIFRMWPSNYLKLLKNSVYEKNYGVLSRMAGSMGALGGITAVPFLGHILKNMEAIGVDTKKAIREYVEGSISDKEDARDVGDMILYGPASKLTGWSMGGALSISDLSPDVEKGIMPGILRTIGGIAPDPLQRMGKAWWLLNEKDSPYRAFESLMPELLRNPMVANRWNNEGVRTPDGEDLMEGAEPLSGYEKAMKFLGGTPLDVARAYEKGNSTAMLKDEATSNDGINFKLAKAFKENDQERVQELMQFIRENNAAAIESGNYEELLERSEQAILSYLIGMESGNFANFRQMPEKARGELLKIQERFAD